MITSYILQIIISLVFLFLFLVIYFYYFRYDPSRPPYEAYSIDFELFRYLFCGISPWGKGEKADDLAARLFRVISLISFFKFYWLLFNKKFMICHWFLFLYILLICFNKSVRPLNHLIKKFNMFFSLNSPSETYVRTQKLKL